MSRAELPTGLSATYWLPWYPSRRGAGIHDSLDPGEDWIGTWDGVGLYERDNKVPTHQVLDAHLTTHRLIIVPTADTPSTSSSRPPAALQTHLSHVRQTEFYAGFLRSSAKITVFLGQPQGQSGSVLESRAPTPVTVSTTAKATNWTCGVCGYVNPLGSTELNGPAMSAKCGLCGVSHERSRHSASMPVTRTTTPIPSSPSAATPSNEEPVADAGGLIACPACTFLNHRSLRECEICSTPLPRKERQNSSLGARPMVPNAVGGQEVVRLSFRKGGEKEAYRRLKNVLSDKVWERKSLSDRSAVSSASVAVSGGDNTPAGVSTPRAGGIDGILQSMKLDSQTSDQHMQSAFQDLEILMVRAGEMVKLAQSLDAKLTAQQASATAPKPTEEEATLIRSSLVQLGLPTPALTQDMVRDQRKYHEGLAGELGVLLAGKESREGLMTARSGGRGVIGLDEAWVLWQRARGVALLSPDTLNAVLPFLAELTSPPIRSMTLLSSLRVLYTPRYEPTALLTRCLERLRETAFLNESQESNFSLMEFSAYEDLPIGLAKEFLEQLERTSLEQGVGGIKGLVRDDQAAHEGGIKWYRDLISEWPIAPMA